MSAVAAPDTGYCPDLWGRLGEEIRHDLTLELSRELQGFTDRSSERRWFVRLWRLRLLEEENLPPSLNFRVARALALRAGAMD